MNVTDEQLPIHPMQLGHIDRGSLRHEFVPLHPSQMYTLCTVTGCGVGVEYHAGPRHDAYLAWKAVRENGGTHAEAEAAHAAALKEAS